MSDAKRRMALFISDRIGDAGDDMRLAEEALLMAATCYEASVTGQDPEIVTEVADAERLLHEAALNYAATGRRMTGRPR